MRRRLAERGRRVRIRPKQRSRVDGPVQNVQVKENPQCMDWGLCQKTILAYCFQKSPTLYINQPVYTSKREEY